MPGNIIIAGKQDPTPNRREFRFNPFTGDETVFEIEGPKAGLVALMHELRIQGFAGTLVLDDKSPIGKIQYQIARLEDGGGGDPPTEIPIPIWEMSGTDQEIDILEADGIYDSMTDEDRRKIREAINNPTEGQTPALSDPDAIAIYALMLKGQRSVPVNLVALRVSRLVSTTYPIFNPLVGVQYIYSSATLRLTENVPNQIFLPPPNTTTDFAYGWRKKFPTITQTGRNKFQLQQEWQYGRWSRFVYGDPL